jgi:hypothetical protein
MSNNDSTLPTTPAPAQSPGIPIDQWSAELLDGLASAAGMTIGEYIAALIARELAERERQP